MRIEVTTAQKATNIGLKPWRKRKMITVRGTRNAGKDSSICLISRLSPRVAIGRIFFFMASNWTYMPRDKK